jgi:periplasmic divalent cation tolerance protein
MAYRLALSTINDRRGAEELARALLADHLVACVNIVGPVTSLYHWHDAIAQDQEYLLIMKTMGSCQDALMRRIQELHPYEVPEVLFVSIAAGSPGYLQWLAAAVASPGER